MSAWMPAALPTIIAVFLVLVPGILIVWAGWGLRRLTFILIAPAASVAVYALSSVLAPWVGVGWSLLPPSVLTVVVAGIAFVLRRRAKSSAVELTKTSVLVIGLCSLVVSGLILLVQFARAFVSPESIAQRFDVIVHLNSVRYALDTANASAFHIGNTSDIGFYPNGWHALTALTASLSGADVATAANATNLVIVAMIWPASIMALCGALFRGRAVAYVSAAALATGFGSFPALFFDWGVLYPNALGYAVLPAALALVVLQFSATGPWRKTLEAALLIFVFAGMTLAHPNALLAGVLFGGILGVGLSLRRALELRSPASWVLTATIALVSAVAVVVLWTFARTPAEHSPWPPYQNIPQAIGSGLFVSPRGYAPTIVLAVLLIVGFVAAVKRPRWVPIVLPFVAAVFLFVLVSGFPIDHPLRIALTNPWYSDSNRIAALLPITVIPVMAAGVVWIVDVLASPMRRLQTALPNPMRVVSTVVAALIGSGILFSVATGSTIADPLEGVRGAYTATPSSLLSADERALLDRLPSEVPQDAVIIGSPRTGVSLAYSISERDVTEMHIFGSPTADEVFLDAHLREIETDPAVCAAVNRTGIDYVLDFGSFDVSGDSDPRGYAGVVDLTASPRLVLVDSEGDNARLFRIQGCQDE